MSTLPDSISIADKLVTNMNEGMWVCDQSDRVIYANPRFCELVGYSLEEIMKMSEFDIWDHESGKKARQINENERKNGKSSRYEGVVLHKNGKRIPIMISGTPLPDGSTMGIVTDIRGEKKQQETQAILQNALEHTTDGIVMCGEQGNVRLWSQGARMIFGYTKEEMMGKPLTTIFAEQEVSQMLQSTKALQRFECIGMHKSKSELQISTTLTPIIRNEDHIPNSYLLVMRDITQQSKFEEEISLKYQKMKEAYNEFGIMRRQMDYIFDLLKIANDTPDSQTVFDFIVASTIMLSRADACILRQYNSSKNMLEMLSSFGVKEDWLGCSHIDFTDSLTEKATELGHPLKVIDITKERKYKRIQLARKYNFSSLLVIPLFHEGKILGSLSLYSTPEKKLEIFDNEFLEKYAHLITLVIKSRGNRDDSK